MGYQHGASHSTATKKSKHCSKPMPWYLHMWHRDKTVREMREGEKGKSEESEIQGDWQTHSLLYWTGVPLPWQPAALDWYLEQRVELLQRIWCSVHIWGQIIWRYNQLLLCWLHAALAIPCLGHSGWHLKPPPLKSLTECQINQRFSSSWQMFVLPSTVLDWQMQMEHVLCWFQGSTYYWLLKNCFSCPAFFFS